MKLSLSTCWLSHRHNDGYEMLREMADLGFNQVELSHGIRISLVPGILKAVDEGWITISSVHNFCPLPPGVMGAAPNLYQPTARNATERDLWFRYSIKTFDFAHRVGAPLVIMHSGSAHFWFYNPEHKLDQLTEERTGEELLADAAYQKSWKKIRAKIAKRAIKHRKLLLESYKRIQEFASIKQVRLGIENRESLIELPLDDDMSTLLAEIEQPTTFGYWHDVGHAQLKHEAGIIAHSTLLETNKDRQWGFHLHDVSIEGKDHQVPGTGTVDWCMVKSFIQPHHQLVLELSPRLTSEEVTAGKLFIESLLEAENRR